MFTPLQDRNLIDFSLNAGVTMHEPILRRDDDTFGIGMGFAQVSAGAAGARPGHRLLSPRRLFPGARQRDLRRSDLSVSGRCPGGRFSRTSNTSSIRAAGSSIPTFRRAEIKNEAGVRPAHQHPVLTGREGDRGGRRGRRERGEASEMSNVRRMERGARWRRCCGADRLARRGRTAQQRSAGRPPPAHHDAASTMTDNGDLNPYAVVVAPVSAGQDPEGRRAGRQFQQPLEPARHGRRRSSTTIPRPRRRRCSPNCRSACRNVPAASASPRR